ncbi:MAG: 16S rRNA (guanine(527)-N(7))-methyltransferase RsmG [Gammaproteobacteria bacterium]|nr:16S rRNA (guanine(527)-N(7))-methyltransferase RsmG [Gammaproteobacteria bacterium]
MNAQDEAQRIADAADALGIALPDSAIHHLLAYRDLIVKWNRVYNLTSVGSADEMIERHLVDSLSIAPLIKRGSVLDIGSGAGLPGIPLAIVLPDRAFTLVDTSAKRTRFMVQAIAELRLTNVRVVQTRIERFSPGEDFTTITSRAFSALHDFVAASTPLLAENGKLIAMKGQLQESEFDPLEPTWNIVRLELDYPGRNGERHAVILSRPAS